MNTEKFYYKNNKEVNLKKVKENPVIPHLYMHEKGVLFYRIQKGKKASESKMVLVKLESKDVSSSISEVEKRKLYKEDDSKAPRKKIEEMKFWYGTATKLIEALSGFSWGGFSRLRLINCFSVVEMKLDGRNLYFNPHWVHTHSERDIVVKLREFIERKI
jgi:hypothetical protein